MKSGMCPAIGFVAAISGFLLCVSCAPREASKTPVAPTPLAPQVAPAAGGSSPAPLPGDRTPGVIHVQQVLELLSKYDQNGRNRSAQTITFQFLENEINEYLAYSLKLKPRPGIRRASVKLLPNNKVSAFVEMDLDTLQKWNSWILPALLQPVLQSKPIRLDVEFQAQDGVLTLLLKDAYDPGGIVIVNMTMEYMIQAIGLHQPEWYDTSRPIPLPFGLTRVWTGTQVVAGET